MSSLFLRNKREFFFLFLLKFLSFSCLSLLFCPSDRPSSWSAWLDSLKFDQMSFGTGSVEGCYLNSLHTYSIRYINEVSFATPLCVFGMDTWIFKTLSFLFSEILNTSELLSFIWDVSICCYCKNGTFLSL